MKNDFNEELVNNKETENSKEILSIDFKPNIRTISAEELNNYFNSIENEKSTNRKFNYLLGLTLLGIGFCIGKYFNNRK